MSRGFEALYDLCKILHGTRGTDIDAEGDLVIFTVSGNGFLYNMVRIMVGTLLFVNEGKLAESDLESVLESRDRTKAGRTVPPQGLYLNKVFYSPKPKEESLP